MPYSGRYACGGCFIEEKIKKKRNLVRAVVALRLLCIVYYIKEGTTYAITV